MATKLSKLAYYFGQKLRHKADKDNTAVEERAEYPIHSPASRSDSTKSLPPMLETQTRVDEEEFVDVGEDLSLREKSSLFDTVLEELRKRPQEAEKEEAALNVKLLRTNVRRFKRSFDLVMAVLHMVA